jgi:hypothetical protein
MRTLIILAAALVLPMAPAFADISVQNSRGGTAEITHDCVRGEGKAVCTTNGTFTGANGKTVNKTRVRTTVPGSSVADITVTGPKGNVRTWTRTTTWGN